MLCPERNQDLPAHKFCGLRGVSADDVLARQRRPGWESLGAPTAAGRPELDKHLLGGLLQVLMAGVGSSATIANALLAIQHAVSIPGLEKRVLL